MIKKILIINIIILTSLNLFADDGSWSANFKLTSGAVYSEIENKDIKLEKELLIYKGYNNKLFDETEAYFLFKNTSWSKVTLDAGFPIKVKIDNIKKQGDYYLILFGRYDDTPGFDFIGKYYNKKHQNIDAYWGYNIYVIDQKNINTRKFITYNEFINKFSNLIELFNIKQDKINVPIDQILIETSINNELIDNKNQLTLKIIFHFKHKLTIEPRKTSILKVAYTSKNYKSHYEYSTYSEWDYFLGTGGTWKDSIKKLYFLVPEKFDPKLPSQFQFHGTFLRNKIYLANNYKPAINDNILISYYHIKLGPQQKNLKESDLEMKWFNQNSLHDLKPEIVKKPSKPLQDFVTIKGASSYLKEYGDVYVNKGVLQNNFNPLSLFDGYRETSWCESVKGNGIDEWVEFEITKDIIGFSIQNGFIRSLYQIENKDIDTYYEKNNRVKQLEIISFDGKIKKIISLADDKNTQYFNMLLPKGVYKIHIKDIYKGSAWDDTCLGEIFFYPVEEKNDSTFFNDEFIKKISEDYLK